jgi:hypothetical protein
MLRALARTGADPVAERRMTESIAPEFLDESAEGSAGRHTRLWWLYRWQALDRDPAVFVVGLLDAPALAVLAHRLDELVLGVRKLRHIVHHGEALSDPYKDLRCAATCPNVSLW